MRSFLSLILTLLVCLPPGSALRAQAGAPAPDRVNVVIVEGEGVINDTQRRAPRGTIVRVEDGNGRPITGAAVLFMLPDSGPGGTFARGARTLLVRTDNTGRAVANGFRANDSIGEFQIRVQASFRGVIGTALITQVNAVRSPEARSGGVSRKLIAILAAVGAAAAVGAVVATRDAATDSTSISISPGTPTIGGPQ